MLMEAEYVSIQPHCKYQITHLPAVHLLTGIHVLNVTQTTPQEFLAVVLQHALIHLQDLYQSVLVRNKDALTAILQVDLLLIKVQQAVVHALHVTVTITSSCQVGLMQNVH